MTTTAQQVVSKLQVEKKIFQELLEMKKYQIRVGRSNEAVLVKRLVKNYNKVSILLRSNVIICICVSRTLKLSME